MILSVFYVLYLSPLYTAHFKEQSLILCSGCVTESTKAAERPTVITATSNLDTCAGAGTGVHCAVCDFVGS